MDWISVKRAWPPHGDRVLGYCMDGQIREVEMVLIKCEPRKGWQVKYFNIIRGRACAEEWVTHWMYRPASPQEEAE